MVNRALQAKTFKMNRMKRTFPKKLSASYIPVGNGPNREVIASYKERTRSLAFDQKYMDWLETVTRFSNVPPGKADVEATWKRIKDACPNLQRVALVQNKMKQVWMYFNQERTQFIIYEENYVGRFVRASIRYQNRDRCISRWKSDEVRWVEFVSSSPPNE